MITLEMVRNGYEAGIIKLIESPHEDGVVCSIGDNWFYFGGETAEEISVVEYQRAIPVEDIVKDIFQVLEDFRKEGDVFEDEYLYYEAFLGEQLRDLGSPLSAQKAADFVKENPALAYEIFRIIDREYQREDIVSRIEDHCDVDIDKFTDAEIDSITARFDSILSHNDSYWESYWASADAAITEVVQEKSKDEKDSANGVGWNSIAEMVDKAVMSIRGVGPDMGSGFYGLKEFEVDGEAMELVVAVCRYENKAENEAYYGVYYWVGYYDGDSLFTDWEYTSQLDVDELKGIINKLANMDFTEDIKKAMGKGSIAAVLSDAQKRSDVSGFNETNALEHVKE